jgi:Tfp pilus assembly protein PilF
VCVCVLCVCVCARAPVNKGDLGRAEELYKKALDTDPGHATTLYNMARLLQVFF